MIILTIFNYFQVNWNIFCYIYNYYILNKSIIFLVFPKNITYIKTSITPIIVNNSVSLKANLVIPSNLFNSSISNNYGLNAYWYALNPLFDSSTILIANSSHSYDQLNQSNYSLNIYLTQQILSNYMNNQIYCQIYPTYNGLESLFSFSYQPYYLGLYIDFILLSSDVNLYNYDYYTQSVHLVLYIYKIFKKLKP